MIELSKAFATDWFKKDIWQKKLNSLIAKEFNVTDWNRLEHDIQDIFSKRQAKKGKTISNTNNLYDTLYDDGTWKLCTPKCFEGSVELASHIEPFTYAGKTYTKTRWCTAAQKNYYKRYTKDGNKLYIIQYWENGKYTEAWQLAFQNDYDVAFMNKYDRENYEDVRSAPDELLELIVCDNPRNKLLQNMSLKDLFDRSISDISVSAAVELIRSEIVKYDAEGYGLNREGKICSLPKGFVDSDVVLKFNQHSIEINGKSVDATIKFTGNNNIKRVKIIGHDESSKIPEYFFMNCENLEVINIHGTGYIRDFAFANCTKLKKVEVEDIRSIGHFAFANCTSLEKINLDNAVIFSNAFKGCTNIKEVEFWGYSLPDEIKKSIEKVALAGWYVPKSEYFQSSNLVEVEILKSVDLIEKSAFENCENLVSVKFPKNKKVKVQAAAFLDCKNLEFVENIGSVEGNLKRIFAGCPKLKSL